MHFIAACLILWGLWKFRNNILGFLFSKFRSSKKDGHNALTYCHSALISGLTDRDRIVFRDNVDQIYRSLNKLRGRDREVDVRYIETLLSDIKRRSNLNTETLAVLEKAFKIIGDEARQAPGNLETELSVEQIYLFLKDNI